jgi:hypothetical protein
MPAALKAWFEQVIRINRTFSRITRRPADCYPVQPGPIGLRRRLAPLGASRPQAWPAPLQQDREHRIRRTHSSNRSRPETQQQRMLDQARGWLGPTGFLFHLLDLQEG